MHESNPLAEMNALDTIRERQQTVSRLRRPRKAEQRTTKRMWRKQI